MRAKKFNFKVVRLAGCIAIGLAVLNTCLDHFGQTHPYNPGVGLADEAIAITGVITLVIARSLQHFEERLNALEEAQH